MYSGTLSLSNSSDVSILKQEVELLTAINTQLKSFTELKSTVENTWTIIQGGSSILSAVASGFKQAASSGEELNIVSKLGATLMSKLSENTTLYAAATKIASGASQVLASIGEITAGKIAALVIAVTAVVAAISTFVKWINRTNEAGEAAKTSAENLVTAQEELSQSAIDRSAAHVTGSFYK